MRLNHLEVGVDLVVGLGHLGAWVGLSVVGLPHLVVDLVVVGLNHLDAGVGPYVAGLGNQRLGLVVRPHHSGEVVLAVDHYKE